MPGARPSDRIEELLRDLEASAVSVQQFVASTRAVLAEIKPLEDREIRRASREYVEDLHRLDNAGD